MSVTSLASISELETLVGYLEQGPPASRSDFEEMYSKHIRGAITQIEGRGERRQSTPKILRILDSDFQDVMVVYSPSCPNPQPEKSVFAQEYRFFVSTLKTYLEAKRT
ncbi:MAG TPA: hypothetical protein VN844_23390 [Pyrinomonadaceae bacterium]|nr:hypothetical protein [Pyrinomonadaceae bacterium]